MIPCAHHNKAAIISHRGSNKAADGCNVEDGERGHASRPMRVSQCMYMLYITRPVNKNSNRKVSGLACSQQLSCSPSILCCLSLNRINTGRVVLHALGRSADLAVTSIGLCLTRESLRGYRSEDIASLVGMDSDSHVTRWASTPSCVWCVVACSWTLMASNSACALRATCHEGVPDVHTIYSNNTYIHTTPAMRG